MQQFRNDFSVEVHVKELLTCLQRNQALHIQQYAEAKKNWLAECIAKADKLKEDLSNGKIPRLMNNFDSPPADMSEEYQLAIDMVKMHDKETLQLDQQQFKAFVKNIWQWSDNWSMSNSKYLSNR